MAYAERNGENPTALGVLRLLFLTGYRREERQAGRRAWVSPESGYVAVPDTKGDTQFRAIAPAAVRVIEAQPRTAGNPHVFPSGTTDGPFTAVRPCLARIVSDIALKLSVRMASDGIERLLANGTEELAPMLTAE